MSRKLLEIVHGKNHWSSEPNLGIGRRNGSGGWIWEFRNKDIAPVLVIVDDLLEGARVLMPEPDALREWACFILAADTLIKFEDIEQSPKGLALIDVLWNLSFDGDKKDILQDLLKLL